MKQAQSPTATLEAAPMSAAGQKTATGVFDTWSGANLRERQTFTTGLQWGVRYSQSDPVGILRSRSTTSHHFAYSGLNPLLYFDVFGLDHITDDPGIKLCYFCMLQEKDFGKDTGELSAWVIDMRHTGGQGRKCHLKDWINGELFSTWPADLQYPPGSVAQAHTHPTQARDSKKRSEPQPSGRASFSRDGTVRKGKDGRVRGWGDIAFAHQVNGPVYTINIEGIWKYDPLSRKTTEEEGAGWYLDIQATNPDCCSIFQ